MKKIRKVQFKNHPVLGNLHLDFCDRHGNAVDTVIIAGENGTGKSTILGELYNFSIKSIISNASLELEENEKITSLSTTEEIMKYRNENMRKPSGIYSDVEINFRSEEIRSVTALALDNANARTKSDKDLPQQINQLLVDIQAQDNEAVAFAVENSPQSRYIDLHVIKK